MLQQRFTICNFQVGSADGLASLVGGNAGVSSAVLLLDIQQDQAVVHVGAGQFIPRSVWFDPKDIFPRLFFHPSDCWWWMS